MTVLTANTDFEETNTPPNSAIILVPVNGANFHPTSHYNFPGETSLKMPRCEANALAVSLNRRRLEERESVECWYVVAYGTNSGFYVVLVQVPPTWQPANEYSLPAIHIENAKNADARRSVRSINRSAMMGGRKLKQWAVHCKPLTRLEDEPAIQKGEQPAREIPIESLEGQGRTIAKSIMADFTDHNGECTSRVIENESGKFVQHPRGWDMTRIDYLSAEGTAHMLRMQASQLLKAASDLDPSNPEELSIGNSFLEVQVGESEDVSLMVFNADNHAKALRMGGQFLASIKGVPEESKCISVDAA